jgi:hypothetical protein
VTTQVFCVPEEAMGGQSVAVGGEVLVRLNVAGLVERVGVLAVTVYVPGMPLAVRPEEQFPRESVATTVGDTVPPAPDAPATTVNVQLTPGTPE